MLAMYVLFYCFTSTPSRIPNSRTDPLPSYAHYLREITVTGSCLTTRPSCRHSHQLASCYLGLSGSG